MKPTRKSRTKFGKWVDKNFNLNIRTLDRTTQWFFYRHWFQQEYGTELDGTLIKH